MVNAVVRLTSTSRRPTAEASYWLGLPNAGLFTKAIEGGRAELLRALRIKRFKCVRRCSAGL